MKTKLFLLLLVLCVLSAQAQNLSVKGRVTDTSQEAIIAANVSLWATDSTLVTGVTSDAQGKFTLNKIKAGNYRLAITFIGYQSEVILLKLNNNLDLGDVQLQEDAVSLGEVTVSASNVLQRVDRQIILPTESQLKRSFGAYDLLNNLGIARLQVDNFTNSMSVSGGGAVQTRINGIKVTDKEIAAIRAKDVLRVEFIEDPGKQYGDDELGAVVNIILDPIFIFGYCGEALSGTTGAAVATVIGQFCGAGMTLYFNTRKNPDIQISFKGFRPSAKAIGRIYTVGLPSIAMQCVGSVMTFLMNQILMAFTATAVAVFGVYFKLQSFVFMPIFGMNNGMVPIIGYNYGARKPDRVKKTIKCAMFYAEAIMLVGFLLFQFLPDKLLGLFSASEAMLAIGKPALRIICFHFLLAGMSIILSSTFQALGNGMFSLIISVCRQLVVLLPAAWLLSKTGNVNMVWWSFVIAELVSVTLSFVFFARLDKKIIEPMYDNAAAAQ